MSFLGFSGLVNSITCIFLAFFVLLKNPKKILSVSYFILNSCVGLYSIGYFFWQIADNSSDALFWFKVLTVGLILINNAYLLFVFEFTKLLHKKKLVLLTCLLINICFVGASISNGLFVEIAPRYGFGYWPKPTVLFHFYLVFWLWQCIYGLYWLLKCMKDTTGRRRDQIRYFTLAAAIGFVGGASNWPLWYNIPFPPYANMLISAYVGVVAYAIVRHNLMDIEVVIKRTAVFAGLMAFVSGTIAAFTILGQSYFESILGWSRWMSMIPSVIVITLALRPLERWLTEATERYLFQKKYDYRQLLRTFTTEVLTVLDLQKLLEKTVEGLTKIIKLESCALLIHDNAINNYQFRAGHGLREDVPMLTASDPLVYYLRATFEPARKTGNIKQITDYKGYLSNFYQLHAEIVLPIVFSEKLIGIIVLGAKKSGEEYTQEDIDILMSLARTEAIAISNAQLFQELARTQAEAAQREKMAVIGTLAAGINHEICNPLGIARGQCEMFLLNHRDGLYKDVPEKELLDKCVTIYNKVIHEIDRATGITKRLSSFAKPSSKFAMGEVVLVQEVDEVLAILGHELRIENIEIMKRIPADLPKLLSDKKQIEEVLFNIIRNAAQAMTEKGSITVTGYEKNDRIFIEIQDTGCGIPPDKLGEIFNPFYTTKAPGKGTGLGLFIVKQVVERNKGTIAVESEVGKGTKFTLSFEAARQMAAA